MNGTKIEMVTLNNGVKMPLLGMGIYQLHGKACEHAVQEAIKLGYRLFDTAQMYGNEKELGNALKSCGMPREELFVTTKLYSPSTSYTLAKTAIEKSLEALQTEYIDLLLIHEPYRTAKEMYQAMKEAYKEGRIRAIGISNFNCTRYLDFIHSCEIIPAVNQVEAHVFFQQTDLQEVMKQHGSHMEAWSPFAAGKNNFFTNPILLTIGKKYGKTAAQIGLKFLIQRGITAIPKSGYKDRLKENIDIFDFVLSDEDMAAIYMLDKGKTLFGWY